MKIIISILGTIATILGSILFGRKTAKQETELANDKQTIQVLSDQQQTAEHISNSSADTVTSELQAFADDK